MIKLYALQDFDNIENIQELLLRINFNESILFNATDITKGTIKDVMIIENLLALQNFWSLLAELYTDFITELVIEQATITSDMYENITSKDNYELGACMILAEKYTIVLFRFKQLEITTG